jgi:membrane-bound ClpP family serine protease
MELPLIPTSSNGPSVTRRAVLKTGGALSAGAVLAAAGSCAHAAPRITPGGVQPLPIAIPDFEPLTPADRELAHSTTQIITANLISIPPDRGRNGALVSV